MGDVLRGADRNDLGISTVNKQVLTYPTQSVNQQERREEVAQGASGETLAQLLAYCAQTRNAHRYVMRPLTT